MTLHHWSLVVLGWSCACLCVVAVMGWAGVVAMSRDVWGVLGTSVLLFSWLASWLYGYRPRWMRVELAFEADQLVVTSTMGRWKTRRAIPRTAGCSVTIAPSRPFLYTADITSDASPCIAIELDPVLASRGRARFLIARGMNIDRATLASAVELVERWRDDRQG